MSEESTGLKVGHCEHISSAFRGSCQSKQDMFKNVPYWFLFYVCNSFSNEFNSLCCFGKKLFTTKLPEIIFGEWISINLWRSKCSLKNLHTPAVILNIAWLVVVRRSRIRLSRRVSWLTFAILCNNQIKEWFSSIKHQSRYYILKLKKIRQSISVICCAQL